MPTVCEACGSDSSPIVAEPTQRTIRPQAAAPAAVTSRLHTIGAARKTCQAVCWPTTEFGDGDLFVSAIPELLQQANVAAILSGMHRHIRHRRVQEAAMTSLAMLCYDRTKLGEAQREKLVNEGGIECIVLSMTVHAASSEVQDWGCRLVYVLSASGFESQATGAGCIERVISAMLAHPEAACVQQWAIESLHLLSYSGSTVHRIKASNGVELVKLAMAGADATYSTRVCGDKLLAKLH
jgi:hypothetical protein